MNASGKKNVHFSFSGPDENLKVNQVKPETKNQWKQEQSMIDSEPVTIETLRDPVSEHGCLSLTWRLTAPTKRTTSARHTP